MAVRNTLYVALTAVLLATCVGLQRPPEGPIPTLRIAPQQPMAATVIVLPGIEDDLDSLRKSGIAAAIQNSMPDAEVILTEAGMPYYADRSLLRRLHEELIEPARQRGMRRIWIAGASLGGFGALLYERDHPGQLSGLVLMAPFMGRPGLAREIADAGGLDRWEPGPEPLEISPDNVPHEVWRMVKEWRNHRELAARVWLICGTEDKFFAAAELFQPLLAADHVLLPPGGHQWKVWTPAAEQVFASIARASSTHAVPSTTP